MIEGDSLNNVGMKNLLKLLFGLFLLIFAACEKDNDGGGETPGPIDNAGHPRILLLEGEETQIRDLINSDETWKKMHLAIIAKSTDLLGDPVLERVT